MLMTKKIILLFLKLVFALNALFWAFVFVVTVDNLFLTGRFGVAEIITELLVIACAVTPYIIYSIANKKLCFDTGEGLAKKLFKYVFCNEKYKQNPDDLEIFQDKGDLWVMFMISLYVVVAGIAFLFTTNPSDPVLIVIVSLLFFMPGALLTFASYKMLVDKTPLLVLDNENMSYRPWRGRRISYSEIKGFVLEDETFKVAISTDDRSMTIDSTKLDFDARLLLGVVEHKIKDLDLPINDVVPLVASRKYEPNKIKGKARAINTILTLSVLSYISYGVLIDRLVLPAKRGRTIEFYGLAADVILIAAIFMSVNLLSYVADHYDKRDNESVYKKIRAYSSRLGWITFFTAMLIGVFQHDRDYSCTNVLLNTVPSPNGHNSAYIFERYCALHDPMNDKTPLLGVSVYDSDLGEFPNEPVNTASFKACVIDKIYWEDSDLFVEYAPKTTNSRKWNMSPRKDPPVPTMIKKTRTISQ